VLREKQTEQAFEGEREWTVYCGRNRLERFLRDKETGECVEGETDWRVF
jgi:hypothetical protein